MPEKEIKPARGEVMGATGLPSCQISKVANISWVYPKLASSEATFTDVGLVRIKFRQLESSDFRGRLGYVCPGLLAWGR